MSATSWPIIRSAGGVADLLSIPANATGLYSAPPWDEDREPSVRWKADRQRKKKARGAKKAADAGTARKTKR